MKVLVTGSAGFIGYHMVNHLISRGDEVVGLDNINDYYDVGLKYARLEDCGIDRDAIEYNRMAASSGSKNYRFIKLDLEDRENLPALFKKERFDRVCHLGAQAGVRYSMTHPFKYIDSNIVGFMNILECCRNYPVEHLVYASSSSVYGLNKTYPFSVHDNVDHPVSLYAATKKSNELMAHCYSHIFAIPVSGLRFFTVYGPWGRPDMAYFSFTQAILQGKPINVFNNGDMWRDFTFVADIVQGITRVLDSVPAGDPSWNGEDPDPGRSSAPYRLYNIGNASPVKLLDFIRIIEDTLGRKAEINFMPMQPGDMYKTSADVSDLASEFDYHPGTPFEEGVRHFVDWFRDYYRK
ncbi:MAG TPA: NAD-dependent epimerase [Spirochaetota bacterium]|nr:NAD-dependent epimerase [Spirochaetota bacterium]HPI90343.1 NAD-dependent epimerase [Spirochaetota bacterium]HPR49432.1 NAD-dependent epimerase [Spirochaetota bacterium]